MDPEQTPRRVGKACEECRRRKSKCEGSQPCGVCVRYGRECSYRSVNRRRRRALPEESQNVRMPNHFEQEKRQSTYSTASVTPGPQLPAQVAQGEDVYQSVSASQVNNHFVMQLHYGPSSNFAFLQHIQNCIGQPLESASVDNSDAEGTSQDLDYFKQREQFFGTPSKNFLLEATQNVALKNFLPIELAQCFLGSFLSSIYQLVPFYNSDQLHYMLKQLYGQTDHSLSTPKTAIILAILAIGSTMSKESRWIKDLYERAKKEALPLEDIVNSEAVQIITF